MTRIRRFRLPRTGRWTPLIPLPVRVVILALWALEPISRGLDYLTGDQPGVTQSLTRIEQAFPLQVWGGFCFISGAMILVGFAGRWRRLAILGLYFAGATYVALGCGLAAVVIERGGDGFRTPVMFFVFGLTYWAAAIGYMMSGPPELIVVDSNDSDEKVPDGSPSTDH
ncbi:membrane protein [Gordonia phage Tracker]|nr:membrane protein [Gordonia phage Tracker]